MCFVLAEAGSGHELLPRSELELPRRNPTMAYETPASTDAKQRLHVHCNDTSTVDDVMQLFQLRVKSNQRDSLEWIALTATKAATWQPNKAATRLLTD